MRRSSSKIEWDRSLSRIVCLGVAAWIGTVDADAQVVTQVTDEKTTLTAGAALDDAGTAVYSGTSADLLGNNPEHTYQIVRFDPQTGSPTEITNAEDGVTATVSLSDDGVWLAFASPADLLGDNHDQSAELFVMQSDGSALSQLTSDPAVNAGSVSAVVISGDGSRVLFIANTDPLGSNASNLPQAFIIDRDGQNLAQLTQFADGSFGQMAISDDATRIVFIHDGDPLGSNADRGDEVFAVNGDGSGLRQLTATPATFDTAGATISGNGQTVAFHSNANLTGGNVNNQVEIFLINWDGTNLRQLTTTQKLLGFTGDPESSRPSLTDDGQRIFYQSNHNNFLTNLDGNFEIYRINADGSGLSALTSTLLSFGNFAPVVSGDGSRVAYLAVDADITLEAMDGNGGNRQPLLPFELIFSAQADLAPGGDIVVFVRTLGLFSSGHLFRVNPDGSGLAQITNFDSGNVADPSLAGDSQTVVFSADSDPLGTNDDLSEEIFKIQVDGTGLAQLTSYSNTEVSTDSQRPAVSTNGSVIVFDSDADLLGTNADFSREIFRVNADGSGLLQLTDTPANRVSQRARIDATGDFLVFESNADLDGGNPDGSFEIYRMKSDGTSVMRITGDPTLDSRSPDISGDGMLVAFHSGADFLGSNAEGNDEIYLYDVAAATMTQLTSFASGSSKSARINGDGTFVFFTSDAEVFEPDPDTLSDIYRVPVGGGSIERMGALKAGNASGAVPSDDAGVAVFSGVGDFTERNKDLQPELWVLDLSLRPDFVISKSQPTELSWSHEAGPLRYDAIRGRVADLAPGAGNDTNLGVVVCLEDDSPDADTRGFGDSAEPVAGEAFFFLYRGTRGLDDGPGTYGPTSAGGSRLADSGDCQP